MFAPIRFRFRTTPAVMMGSFIPVVATSSDRALTSTHIRWIFRLPEGTLIKQALRPSPDQPGPSPHHARRISMTLGQPCLGPLSSNLPMPSLR